MKKLREKITNVSTQLEQLQEADDNYFIMSKHVLDLTSRAHKLFETSEVEEKRQLIKLILSTIELDGEKLVWHVHKPFDLILEMNDCQLWRQPEEAQKSEDLHSQTKPKSEDWLYLINRFRQGKIEFNISLSHIQTAYSVIGIKSKI